MKIIKKKSVVPLPPTAGSITDTFNIQNQVTNAPSLRLTKHMMGIPTDGIIPFEGDEIPEGYEEVENPNLEVYSTEETLTGETWIDGKPIYRKVINIDIGTSINGEVSLNVTNINNIWVNPSKSYYDNGKNAILPMMQYAATSDWARVYITNKSTLNYQFGGVYSSYNKICYITVEYTKTTD